MNLYLIWQNANKDYDTYDSAVVCAASEEDAKTIHPEGRHCEVPESETDDGADRRFGSWTARKNVRVKWIGTARSDMERGVVLASFNAG